MFSCDLISQVLYSLLSLPMTSNYLLLGSVGGMQRSKKKIKSTFFYRVLKKKIEKKRKKKSTLPEGKLKL